MILSGHCLFDQSRDVLQAFRVIGVYTLVTYTNLEMILMTESYGEYGGMMTKILREIVEDYGRRDLMCNKPRSLRNPMAEDHALEEIIMMILYNRMELN